MKTQIVNIIGSCRNMGLLSFLGFWRAEWLLWQGYSLGCDDEAEENCLLLLSCKEFNRLLPFSLPFFFSPNGKVSED